MKDSAHAITLLLLLFVGDAFFAFLHLSHIVIGIPGDGLYSLGTDRGFGEFYQYIKEIWCFLLFLFLVRREKKIVYFFWSLLFLYFFLDDFLKIHETTGEKLIPILHLKPALGLRAKDFGELLVSAGMGIGLLVPLVLSTLSSDPNTKRFSVSLFLALGGLTFFGVIVDMIHQWADSPFWSSAWLTIEDGGEMVMMSLMTALAFYGRPFAIMAQYDQSN